MNENYSPAIISLLRSRRSIRKFKTQPVEPDKIDLLIEALKRSPSSRNLNPWEFIMVDDPELLQDLSECKPHGAAFLAGAPLGIVIAADPDKCDVWIEDCSIASILVQMTAQDLGLGSCWIQIRLRSHLNGDASEAHIRRILGFPEDLHVLSIIAIGYPDENPAPHDTAALPEGKIHHNRF